MNDAMTHPCPFGRVDLIQRGVTWRNQGMKKLHNMMQEVVVCEELLKA